MPLLLRDFLHVFLPPPLVSVLFTRWTTAPVPLRFLLYSLVCHTCHILPHSAFCLPVPAACPCLPTLPCCIRRAWDLHVPFQGFLRTYLFVVPACLPATTCLYFIPTPAATLHGFYTPPRTPFVPHTTHTRTACRVLPPYHLHTPLLPFHPVPACYCYLPACTCTARFVSNCLAMPFCHPSLRSACLPYHATTDLVPVIFTIYRTTTVYCTPAYYCSYCSVPFVPFHTIATAA